jgi:hypothetical protein
MPVYTDAGAWDRVQDELQGAMEAATHTGPQIDRIDSGQFDRVAQEWYVRMGAYETPHKRLSDLGMGLFALGAGLVVGFRFIVRYYRDAKYRTAAAFLKIWFWLWAIKIPSSFLYFFWKAWRKDYPTWSESIMIPIFEEGVFAVVGWGVTTVILWLLLRRRVLAVPLQLDLRPQSLLAWARAIFISLWIGLLVLSVIAGAPEGDFGLVFPCMIAGVLLSLVLVAPTVIDAASEEPKTGKIDTLVGI